MGKNPTTPVRYYPVFLAIEGKTCLVVGAGAVGERKIGTLLEHGARIRLVAREVSAWIEERCSENRVSWVGERYEKSHLLGVSLAFAATDDFNLNRTIAADARELGIWCNTATEPDAGSFVVPSIVERGALNIAVSTSGLSPAIAKVLRQKLEMEIGPEWDFFVRLLGGLRECFKVRGIAEGRGRDIFTRLAGLPIPEWLRQGRGEQAFTETLAICRAVVSEAETRAVWDSLWNLYSWQ